MVDIEIDDDRTAAYERIRPQIAVMAGGAYAAELIPRYGLSTEELAPLRAAVRAGDPEPGRHVTDEIVDAFAIGGTHDEVAARLEGLAALGVGRIIAKVSTSDGVPGALDRMERLASVTAAAFTGRRTEMSERIET